MLLVMYNSRAMSETLKSLHNIQSVTVTVLRVRLSRFSRR
jgi:hypothetical protein